MHRKKLLMLILVSTTLLFTACSREAVDSSTIDTQKKDVDISFIDVPKKISIMSNMYQNEINSLNEEWAKGQNTNNKEAQQKLLDRQLEYYKAATIETADEEFIKTVFDAIKKEKASVWNSSRIGSLGASSFEIEINDKSLKELTDDYLSSVSIFDDGTVFLTINNSITANNGKSKVLKLNLKTNNFEYIQKYFDDHKSTNFAVGNPTKNPAGKPIPGDVDLSFINVPKKISVMSNMYQNEIKLLAEEWQKGQNTNDKESQQKLLNKQLAYLNAATIETEDKKFIETVFDAIKKEKASVWDSYRIGPEGGSSSCFMLDVMDKSQISTDKILDGVTIFDDGSAYLIIDDPKKTTVLKSTVLRVNLKTNDYEYIQKYFDAHKKSN